MEADHIALSSLSDEELLLRCYMSRHLMTPMEQELSMRLEHLLDELGKNGKDT